MNDSLHCFSYEITSQFLLENFTFLNLVFISINMFRGHCLHLFNVSFATHELILFCLPTLYSKHFDSYGFDSNFVLYNSESSINSSQSHLVCSLPTSAKVFNDTYIG